MGCWNFIIMSVVKEGETVVLLESVIRGLGIEREQIKDTNENK